MPALRVGAATADIPARDPRFVAPQRERFRATAVIIECGVRLCLVSITDRKSSEPLARATTARLAREIVLDPEGIVIVANHTHCEPVMRADFLEEAMGRAAVGAMHGVESSPPVRGEVAQGWEATVGQNSRPVIPPAASGEPPLILWTPLVRSHAFERPTWPIDPALPVVAFRDPDAGLRACLFTHSTHNIGRREGEEYSPGFYEMVAQALERSAGGTFLFLAGAAGSTHNLVLAHEEMAWCIRRATVEALAAAEESSVASLRCVRGPFTWRVRHFDGEAPGRAVSEYCRRMRGGDTETVANFRARRRSLAPHRGEERRVDFRCALMGEIAVVALPGELFTGPGLQIKRRSPFRHTLIVRYANGHMGYLPDREACALGALPDLGRRPPVRRGDRRGAGRRGGPQPRSISERNP